MENQEIMEGKGPLTAIDVRRQVNLIQEVMKEVMLEGQHYGKIPGCGNKPTLLKPGAEKLSMVFRLRPVMNNHGDIIIEKLDNNHREVTVYCHIMDISGNELATGIGSCSTMESKYRYRGGEKIPMGKPVPTEYWNLKKAGKIKEAQKLIGGEDYGASKIEGEWQICKIGEKMENPDIADVYNTTLKMAKKRAYVDGILSATAASDIFTQDIEDLPAAIIETTANHKPAVDMPQPAKESQAPETEVSREYNVIEALVQPIGAVIDVWGILFDCKEYKSTKKDKNGKLIIYADYKVSPRETSELITIRKFGAVQEGLGNGDTVVFRRVEVQSYRDEKKFLAQEIEILEKAQDNES